MTVDKSDAIGQMLEIGQAKNRLSKVDAFAAAAVQVGTEVFIDVNVSGKRIKVKSELIGYRKGEYIIIETPRINGASVRFSTQELLVARYMQRGCIFGFHTSVLRAIAPPFNLLFLKYPDAIEEVSLRREPRVQVVIPLERKDGDPAREWIMNLSANGALLQLATPPKVDEVLYLSFVLPNGQAIQGIGSTVRRLELNANRCLAGVQFDGHHEKFNAISNYVKIVVETLGLTLDGK